MVGCKITKLPLLIVKEAFTSLDTMSAVSRNACPLILLTKILLGEFPEVHSFHDFLRISDS